MDPVQAEEETVALEGTAAFIRKHRSNRLFHPLIHRSGAAIDSIEMTGLTLHHDHGHEDQTRTGNEDLRIQVTADLEYQGIQTQDGTLLLQGGLRLLKVYRTHIFLVSLNWHRLTLNSVFPDVLRSIEREWDFVATDDCVPVQVALQLMDTSTIGKAEREPDFLNVHQTIQHTLKMIVNEHHQGFNSSIGTYHKIQAHIQSSQGRVRGIKHSLEDAKGGLMSTKPELKELATSSQKYDDIIQLFSQIQEIQSLPEKLESRLSDKRFLGAVEVLHDALRLLRRSELANIGALSDVRAYFENQESSITEILVEELHDHLYLKSPYCSDRWKPPNSETESTGINGTGAGSWERPVYGFLARLDASSPMVEDASRNPEADTFSYLQLLIEVLNKMGHLDIAVDRIEQRLPVELFTVVDKTNAEIDARYPLPRSSLGQDEKADSPTELLEKRGHVLSEFLWALYAKFEAIAEGHRVVHDVITAIVEREGIPKSSSLAGGFKELWKLYQSEVCTIIKVNTGLY